ncbi:MAG: type II secretion system protein [Chloroflexi bacterium]|nr:type II secretion system protein [Chloroflexota bacterium]
MREKGFTFIELLVSLAVSSVILTVAVPGIYRVLVTTGKGSHQTVALTDINQAALAIKNDLLMAQATDLVDGAPKSSANLTWIDYTTSFGTAGWTSHSSTYALSGKELRRTYYNGNNSTVSTVARNITSLSFTQNDKSVSVVIASNNTTSPAGVESIRFSVHLRPEEIQ